LAREQGVVKAGMGDQKSGSVRKAAMVCGTALIVWAVTAGARAETVGGALIKAYLNNPDINSQRAAVRASDEGMPKAESGYLPTVTANLNGGVQSIYAQDVGGLTASANTTGLPRGYGVTVNETIWNGQKTFNSVRQAESTVLGQREQLRFTEQNTLLSALTSYMDVMQNTAVLDLNHSNVEVLKEQLRQTRDRFNVGEVTRTDVAQAEASLANAEADYATAHSTLETSIAQYRQVVGDQPRRLAPVAPLTKLLPPSLPLAISISQVEHPAITAYLHGIDVALLNVKINEAALYPTVSLQGSLTKYFDVLSLPGGSRELVGALIGQVNIPIYDGGSTFASIRQAKEQVSQQELTTDSQREKVRESVVSAWGANQISVTVVRARKAQVQAAEVALAGVREEAKVGQRTTLDVLNAQQTLLQSRVSLVQAQHDQVVNSYTLLSSVGRLSVRTLGLSVAEYDPRTHFNQVKGKWFGVRTPDGR
jgi:outer membrane protein